MVFGPPEYSHFFFGGKLWLTRGWKGVPYFHLGFGVCYANPRSGVWGSQFTAHERNDIQLFQMASFQRNCSNSYLWIEIQFLCGFIFVGHQSLNTYVYQRQYFGPTGSTYTQKTVRYTQGGGNPAEIEGFSGVPNFEIHLLLLHTHVCRMYILSINILCIYIHIYTHMCYSYIL